PHAWPSACGPRRRRPAGRPRNPPFTGIGRRPPPAPNAGDSTVEGVYRPDTGRSPNRCEDRIYLVRRRDWMRTTPTPLLCELHAPSTWSDGDLPLAELVDLYGESGFDVLCVTDHIGRPGWEDPSWCVRDEKSFADYLADIEQESSRARLTHGLLVIP